MEKRYTTIYLEEQILTELRRRAKINNRSVSFISNELLKRALNENSDNSLH